MKIYLAFLVVLCNMLSWQASKLLTSLFAIDLGATQFSIGTIIGAYSLFPTLLAFYAGKLSDRLGVRTPMLCGTVGVIIGIALPWAFPMLSALYVSAALIGASHVFYNVSMQSLIGVLSTQRTRSKNYSNFTLVISVANMLGPLAAGFSIDHFGYPSTYLYLACVPLVSVCTLACFFPRGAALPPESSAESTKTVGQRASLLRNAPLRRILIAGGVVVTGSDLFQFYMPIYGHSIGLSASTIGVIVSCFALAAFAARMMMPPLIKRWGETKLLLRSIVLSATVYLLFPFFASAVLLGIFASILGLGMGCCAPLTLSIIYTHAPAGRAGEAMGLRLTMNNFTHMSVPLVFGALGTLSGVAPVFIANTLLLAGSGVLVARLRRG